MKRYAFATALGIAGAVFVNLALIASGQQQPGPRAKLAMAKIDQYLKDKGGPGQRFNRYALKSTSLKSVFPNYTFVAMRYPQYPVAVAPPKGLKSSNVFAVPTKKGSLELITDNTALTKFFVERFKERMEKVDAKRAKAMVRAWLSAQHELIQDGFFQFEIVSAKTRVDDKKAIHAVGRSLITKGGNGEIKVTMIFGEDGSISVADYFKIKVGPRPKCQATKLLDADPIVRYMAESELLYMGLAAKPYLLEQRAKAAPPLRAAIDRLIEKIEAAGW